MAKVGAQRAAELTGRSKSTIQRAMKAGKLSYEVDSAGRRVIDVSELDRAFGLMPQDTAPRTSAAVEVELEKATHMLETERLKMRVRMLEDQLDLANGQIEDLKIQRDQWQKQAQQVLITSQYSQKHADELKEELKERDRRAMARRQHVEQQRRGGSKPAPQSAPFRPQPAGPVTGPITGNENVKTGPITKQRQDAAIKGQGMTGGTTATDTDTVTPAATRSFDIQGLWKKVRGQNDKNVAETTDETVETRAAG